jgi:[acyl-carrier-protein] S-malonyltransferase
MTKTAWVFPGQGSQASGMGVELQQTNIGKEKFTQAQDILGWSVLEVCAAGDERLSQTIYTQPCLYTVEAILVDLLKQEGQTPDLVAGHSLGEYVALYSAGVYSFEEGLQLVKRRAELMSKAEGGKMVALMKFDRDVLENSVSSHDQVVIANDNSEGQVVISGTPAGIEEVLAQVKAKKAVELKVSGAFHSPLMAEAAKEFSPILNSIEFQEAQIPIMSNVDPQPTTQAAQIKQRLLQQMTGGVRWREIMLGFTSQGVTDVVEVGPGKVLSGLIKRTNGDLTLTNVGTYPFNN